MRRARHRGSVAATVALAVLGMSSCSGTTESTDTAERASTTTSSAPSTTSTVPPTTTSVLPPCSEVAIDSSYVTPARWLPAEVPDDWRLEAAATVRASGTPAWPIGNQFGVLDGDIVTGMVAVGTGTVTLSSSEPVTVRGTEGSWGFMAGRSDQADDPYLLWREDGVDWKVSAFGMEKAAVVDAVAPVELSDDPVQLTDPTGRLVQVADRPADLGSTMVLLSYEVPGGSATPPFGAGTESDDGEPTDRVLVIIEQFAPGGSGILVDNVSGSLGQAVGWRLVTLDGRPVLRTPDDAQIPVVSGEAQVPDGSDARVAVSVTGAPSAAEADAVMARVIPVEPSDERLATARVDVGGLGEIDLTACLPD